MKITIGVTGGIGSGKSFVSDLLRAACCVPVYDCDSAAKRICDNDDGVKRRLIALAGNKVYSGGRLVRSELARYTFSGTENAHKVEAVIHPAVKADFMEWRRREPSGMVGIESAILYASGFDSLTDYVVFVDADQETRIARAIDRDGTDRRQVEARIAMQPVEDDKARASHIIYNVGKSRAELTRELRQVIDSIKENNNLQQ